KQRIALLERYRFTLVRETYRFDWHAYQELPPPSPRLHFRSLAEVGEAAFLAAIVRVSEGTLDRSIAMERQEKGPARQARDLFTPLQQLGYEPERWQLAYTPDGSLVGLHMPTMSPTAATIGYIGVVPEQRGQGYIDDLLAQLTRTLAQASAERIIADTDVGNFPMAGAFRRAGYTQFGKRREYSRRL
ncbi:MAG TPA: GNAT family N-acetyltransferase, partial [Ktedonobacterales bacterium]|nr:GNAT family N-acetyltransferase [Ktedonobacterales bacterium]